ncbi:MAG: hypothetical protein NT011_02680 [Kiritimatiellaeota bacterium]|nr:hypothetical protein [Kiritimatiellota bacterium]
MTGMVNEPGGFIWVGGLARWDGTIPDNFAGTHGGRFSGTYLPPLGGPGTHIYTWEADTKALVSKIRVKIKNHTKLTYDGLNSDGYFECQIIPACYHASDYNWKYEWILPGLNNPQVSFVNPTGSETAIAKAHWYSTSSNPLNYDAAVYKIYCEATVDGTLYVNEAEEYFYVEVYNPAGYCERPVCTYMDFTYTKEKGKYTVTGIETWAREDAAPYNQYASSSQFYQKVEAHEQQHKVDYNNGFAGHVFYSAEEFAPQIIGLQSSNWGQLQTTVKQKFNQYCAAEELEMDSLFNTIEDRAFAISDAITPFLVYQRGGAGL